MELLSLASVKFREIHGVILSVTFHLNNKYKIQLKVNYLSFYQDSQPVNFMQGNKRRFFRDP
jgi:hypothetical protein